MNTQHISRGRPAHRRDQVLSYVRSNIAENGRAPSYSMICDALGIRTRQEVCRIVGDLERLGKLRRAGRGRVRRIRSGIYANSQMAPA
jgi:hypothetical protein